MMSKNNTSKKLATLAATGMLIGSTLTPTAINAWQANSPETIKQEIGKVSNLDALGKYRLRYGDTLWGISQATNFNVDEITNKFGIQNPNRIHAGDLLGKTRSGSSVATDSSSLKYTVAYGDTLFGIANGFNTTVNQLVSWNDINNPDLIFPGEVFKVGEKAVKNENTSKPTDSNGAVDTPAKDGTVDTNTPSEDVDAPIEEDTNTPSDKDDAVEDESAEESNTPNVEEDEQGGSDVTDADVDEDGNVIVDEEDIDTPDTDADAPIEEDTNTPSDSEGNDKDDTVEDEDAAVNGDESGEDNSDMPLYTNEDIQDLVSQRYIKVEIAEDLNNVRNNMDGKYIQVADIDLSGYGYFEPIGDTDTDNTFKGIYDGGGYKIKNLTVDKGASDNDAGLFGRVERATLKNIGLVDVNVSGGNYVGGLVGHQYKSSVSNSYAMGQVNGEKHVGGLVGDQIDSSVSNSYATGTVNSSGDNVGGLVGHQDDSSVSDSYATGTVNGSENHVGVGGLVGWQRTGSKVLNSYATGEVNGGHHVGGLVGHQINSSSVSNSYATGQVNGRGNVGGLVGHQDDSSVSDSYATGQVNGGGNVGGLVGRQIDSSVSNSYATGTIDGSKSRVGGLVGRQEGQQGSSSVSNSYATGTVNGSGDYVGGLVGLQQTDSFVSNSYYDTETTGQSDAEKGMGRTTEQMKEQDTYSNWNFTTTWEISEGEYPTLQ